MKREEKKELESELEKCKDEEKIRELEKEMRDCDEVTVFDVTLSTGMPELCRHSVNPMIHVSAPYGYD